MCDRSWDYIHQLVDDYEGREGIFSFVNPYSMMKLKNQGDWLKKVDGWHVDGISLVKWLSWSLGRPLNRYSFDDTSLAPIVFRRASQEAWRVVLIGSDSISIENSVRKLKEQYDLNIVYFRNGFFSGLLERESCLMQINELNPDLVVVGMGAPLQEKFLVDLVGLGWRGRGYTCGGYFHQLGGSVDYAYYPNWMNKMNLRWLFRMVDEPKLIRRYMLDYPIFFMTSLYRWFVCR